MDMKDSLWARAEDVIRWRRDLTALREMVDTMLGELGDLQCFRFVSDEPLPADLEIPKKAEPAAKPDPKPAEEISETELDEQAKRLLAEHRMRQTVEIARSIPDEPERPVKSRVSFPALCRRIHMEYGAETLKYAVDLCGVDRTAMKLKQVMVNFLGVFRTNVDAGRAFCAASGKAQASDADAVAALANARHKVSVPGRGLAVWLNDRRMMRRQQPGEVSAGQRDPSHAWHKMVEQAQKSDAQVDEDDAPEPQQPDPEPEAEQPTRAPEVARTGRMPPEHLSDDDIAAFC